MFGGMEFKSHTLTNQLQLLAISDKRFVKSSASLAVMAGSMQNPDEHLGLAHFLEHMLFLGTQDFPQVGTYEDYLNKNGGGHNAYTSIDHTNYFFDVTHPAFEGALQRFSRFFVCPTFDPQYVEREKNAVHSEHEKNYKDDGRREYRFLQMMTDPEHPFSKFATGDKNTLSNADRDVVMDFYRTHYSSNLMRLVLMSPQPCEKIIQLAEKYFSDIENKSLPEPVYSDQLFAHMQTPQFHQVQTVRDQKVLKLSFSLPDDMPYWKTKPTSFLAHLVGEEGPGSLLSYLKKQNWAQSLESSTWWRMFHVRIKMTETGCHHQDDIIKSVFSYFELLKREGLKSYLFTERKVLAEVELNSIEPKSSMGRASHFSAALLYYPADEFLKRYYLYHDHSEQDFHFFLNKLTPENMQVTLFSSDEVSGNKEPYYGIPYKSEAVDQALLNELKSPLLIDYLAYPEPNPFVPDDLSLVEPPAILSPQHKKHGQFANIYSQVDTELDIPKASLSLTFISDQVKTDPRRYLLAKLFARLKNEELNEWGYPARLAGLNFQFSFGYNSLTLETSGYSQHLVKLVGQLIFDQEHQRQINRVRISQDDFARVRYKFKQALVNKDHDAAYQHLMYEMGQLLTSSSVNRHAYIDMIDQVTLDEVNQFAQEFFDRVSVRAFSYGNLKLEPVQTALDIFFKQITSKGFSEDEVSQFENKFITLPQAPHALSIGGSNNNNAQLSIYPIAEWTIRDQAYISVISKVLEQPFFTELRTHQQLGYVVAAFASVSYGFAGLGTLIQSQTHSAPDIYERSHQFVLQFFNQLADQTSSEDLETIKQSIISELAQKPNSMGERLGRFMLMAGTYHGAFDFFDRLIQEVQAISLASYKEYVNKIKDQMNHIQSGQHLCLFYQGADNVDTHSLSTHLKSIDDISEFKKQQKWVQPYKSIR
jgi:insulysin